MDIVIEYLKYVFTRYDYLIVGKSFLSEWVFRTYPFWCFLTCAPFLLMRYKRKEKALEIKYKDIYGYEFLFSTVLIHIDNLYLGRLRLELGHKNRKLFKKLVDENKKL